MIVKVGGWLFIVNALLALWSLMLPMPFGGGASIAASLFTAALFGSVGVGLLNQKNWARWLALGMSLLTWTLGTAAVLYALPGTLRLVFAASGMFSFLIVIFVFVAAIVALVIIINFKLFHYLNSDEGRFEFDTPDTETQAVLKSAGVYALVLFAFFMADYRSSKASVDSAALERALRDSRDRDAEERRHEAARRDAVARAEDERARVEQALQEQEPVQEFAMEPSADSSQYAPAPDAPSPPDASYGSAAPVEAEPRESEQEPQTNKILKCRDSSGAVSFTQGYCPPGTQRVETPNA
ncbi:MAG TPA: hypothetical protein VIV63_06860, partial [Steroidobacteraceae bacterium]